MATRIYSLNRGDQEFKVVEGVGLATVAENIELTVDLAVNLTKSEVLLALDEIKNHIITGNWPPA